MAKLIDKELERELVREVERSSIITREKLIEIVYKRHKESEKKVSVTTLIRYIDNLRELKRIVLIKKSDYKRFSIKSSDKRNAYLTLPNFLQSFEHVNEVLIALKSHNEAEHNAALLEIESLNVVRLAPSHLIELISLLPKKQIETVRSSMRILWNYIKDKIYPDNKNILEEKLAICLKMNKKELENQSEHSIIIVLLGILNSNKVIEFLKEDIEKGYDQEKLEYLGYMNWSVANIIANHAIDLFQFSKSLKKDKQITLATVKKIAEKNLSMYRNKIVEYDELIGVGQ